MALPNPSHIERPLSLLRHWDLCQNLVLHFWKRWSIEYLTTLNKFHKWNRKSRNLMIGDVVLIIEKNPFTNKWPLGQIVDTHPGRDGHVRVVTIKTANGVYKRPVTKVALLLECE